LTIKTDSKNSDTIATVRRRYRRFCSPQSIPENLESRLLQLSGNRLWKMKCKHRISIHFRLRVNSKPHFSKIKTANHRTTAYIPLNCVSGQFDRSRFHARLRQTNHQSSFDSKFESALFDKQTPCRASSIWIKFLAHTIAWERVKRLFGFRSRQSGQKQKEIAVKPFSFNEQQCVNVCPKFRRLERRRCESRRSSEVRQ
jgi:hypothetical protein